MTESTAIACPVCRGRSDFLDTLDGNRSCEDRRGALLGEAGWRASYFLCRDCQFCFSPEFRNWSDEEFKRRIYNADYARVDPDYLEVRPRANARLLQQCFGQLKGHRHLDYGGGDGRLSELLKQAGWSSSFCDPFHADRRTKKPTGRFPLVTAFEVFEHAADPHRLVEDLQRHLARPGLLLFSTLLSDGRVRPGQPLDWWYAAPRNGHISLFSTRSLASLASQHQLHHRSFSDDVHAFWSELPGWAAHLLDGFAGSAGSAAQDRSGPADTRTPMSPAGDDEDMLRSRVRHNPRDHAAWHALGLLAFDAGNPALAVQCIEAAIAVNGRVALYQRNIGEMYRRTGQLDKSAAAGRRASRLAPHDIDAHYNLGLAYTDARDYPRAITAYRHALQLNPQHGLSWNNLGSALEQQGDKAAALAAYERAIAIDPRHAEAQNNAGAIYSEQGRLDEARACFSAAIAAKGDFVEAHYNLSSLKTYRADDPHLAMLEGVYARRAGLGDHARIRYSFALGKALDDCGDYDRAFAAYEEGNRLQHALLPIDENRADALLARIVAVFDGDFFAARQGWPGSDKSPIFVVGMPRSGTTLLEQILSSHPSVHGAGELVDLSEVVMALTGADAGRPFTEGVAGLGAEEMRRLGEEYVERVWRLAPGSSHITDKMPANFFYLGLIHLALPNAKIIHAMRDPMDSCFSCYSRLFNDTMEFAYDQGTLGRYYVRYFQLMRHWQRVLPAGRILDLRYEDMVADTEGQARRVLDFVGLPWDARCLDFHENRRLVKTASVAQVRKPIYRTSVARWKHFARHLRPLYDIVKDCRPADDTFDRVESVARSATPQSSAERTGGPGAPVNAAADCERLHLQGIAAYKLGSFAEALALYERALAAQPNFPAALNSKGFVLQDMNRLEEALACFQRAVDLAPEFAMARLNLGMAQLKLGDWANGWDNYEARWTGSAEAGNGTLQRPATPLPQWQGQADTQHKRLLVITEQGYGDTFQFARFLPLAARRFAKVGFVCSQPTLRLLEWTFADDIVILSRLPADYAAWDWQCPLLSLPRAFATRPETVPRALPYLRVPAKAAAHWRERLDLAAAGSLRVGIAWAGRPAHQYDARRSLRFEQILPLLHDERITWVSLQKWAAEDRRPELPDGVDWLDWTEELSDFADTAALLANLDLVISIDSAMVHLAGALSRPVWMLNRFDAEWRWFRQRADSPWYASLRIFNQPSFGDWQTVLNDVRQALAALPGRRIAANRAPAKRLARPTAALVAPGSPAGGGLGERFGVDQAMHLASQHQSAGRLTDAERILRQVLQEQPRHAHALHLLGVVAYQAGQADTALRLIAEAVAIDDRVALFHSNLAEMNRQQGRVDVAILHGERAVALDASMASAHGNLGIAYYDARDYERAEACHRRSLALAPRLLQSLNNMGSIAHARKDLKAAADWYRQALAVNADYLESLSNLGAVLVEDDDPAAAVAPLQRALQLQPAYPEALCNLGLARIKQERVDEGIALLQRSLQLRPDYPESLVGLARGLYEQDQLADAERLLRRALERAPDKVDAWCQLGSVCMEQGEAARADAAYGCALELDASSVDALTGMGNLRLEEGKIDAAEALLCQAIEIAPDNLGARFHLTQTKKVKPGDANLIALEAMRAEAEAWNDDKRISWHYALGKAYDDLGEYDRAFPHFMAGARLKRAKLSYDAAADAARARRIAAVVDHAFVERLAGGGNPSALPIFVLGMPRSGTTLTEQIIASHPEVFGAGELRELMEIVQGSTRATELLSYPDNLAGLTREVATAWGDDYVARLGGRAPDAMRITDKMPANYLALGLIPLLLPAAKIIHVRRNAVDTCLSCFTRLFNRHQDATYDLFELGRHYRNYAMLMEHWRALLPPGAFLEVRYEDIVADIEGQARRLIDFCALEWHDSCLAFYENKRSVRTASVTQVRQPIYTSSVERWRHYEKFLGPLLEGLGEYAPGC
jgi:tetratricopeptide (TPR) repeat protein